LSVVASVSGVAPMAGAGGIPKLQRQDHAVLETLRRAPYLAWPLMALGGVAWQRSPERMYRRLEALCPPADRVVLARPDVTGALVTGVQEAFRAGSRGAADELRLFIRPWGFPLEEIAVPVHIWHGARDTLVPCVAAQRLAGSIPDCRVEIIPDGGHYLVYGMLDELLATARRAVDVGLPGAARHQSHPGASLPAGSLAGG
jgi:pimeloyl-ACP methyl ester carboxylesterase